MPKKRLKQLLPKPEELRKSKIINLFAPFLVDPRLWHLTRGSLIRATYVGVMAAFFPLPGQMALAIVGALLFRANLAMSVALTWLTNPLTALPIYWFAYWVGATLLGEPIISIRTIGIVITDMTLWLTNDGPNPFGMHKIFSIKVFAVGLFITAVLTSLSMGLALSWFWRYKTSKNWKNRTGYRSNNSKINLKNPK